MGEAPLFFLSLEKGDGNAFILLRPSSKASCAVLCLPIAPENNGREFQEEVTSEGFLTIKQTDNEDRVSTSVAEGKEGTVLVAEWF